MKSGYLRSGLWRKVYLLEFYKHKNNATPTETFAFGVPPESEEITLGMRKTETKTFGGLIIDDYGCDCAYKITLTGSSVNNELRKIYNPHGASKFLTGEEEIYTFRAFLEKCKQAENLNGYMLLYDLSKHSENNAKRKVIDGFCWQVFPGELKIKRSKEKPLAYTYTIEFTAIPQKTRFYIPDKIKKISFEDRLNRLFIHIDSTLWDKLRKATKMLRDVVDKINKIRNVIKACKAFVKALIKSAIDTVKEMMSTVLDIADSTIALWHEMTADMIPFVMELADYAAMQLYDLEKQFVQLTHNIRSIATADFYLPKKEAFSSLEVMGEKMFEEAERIADEAHYEAATLSVMSKSTLPNQIEITLEDEKENGIDEGDTSDIGGNTTKKLNTENDADNGKSTKIYGAKVELITDGASFESIAVEHYGDASKAEIIAKINSASSIDELIRNGNTKLIVPTLEKKTENTNNLIIGLSGQRDDYGVDIALDEKGEMSFDETGFDLKLTRGKNNLSQAILNRLRENINKRVMQQYYGIRTTLPDEPAVSNAYILSSIIQTLQMEPRIKEILGVSFNNEADALRVDIDYTDIAGEINNLQGVV